MCARASVCGNEVVSECVHISVLNVSVRTHLSQVVRVSSCGAFF